MPAELHAQPADSAGAALRRLREQRGLTVREVADQLGWSGSKLSRVETSATRIKADDLSRALEFYGADSEVRREIEDLLGRVEAAARNASGALPEAYGQYADMEARASRISLFGAVLVPGLLQIPEYAAAVIRATPEPEEHLAKERLDTRLLRQAVFAQPMALDVVLDEAALRRPIGGPDVMRRQMTRLQEFKGRPRTTIRVLPFAVGAHPALTGSFSILDFDHGGERVEESVVFCDGLTGGVLRSRPEDVHRYRACFAALQQVTLDTDKSAQFLASVAD